MPKFGSSTSFSHTHDTPTLPLTQTPIYTKDALYSRPSVVRVVVKSLDKSKTLYFFDHFTYGDNYGSVIYCSLNLGTNQHGNFEVEFEDSERTIDDTIITSPARCYIFFGKSFSNMHLMLSGMIRESGYTRGFEDNLLYSISGFGTGIRLNERILDARETADKLEDDNQTIDQTDPNFRADTIVDDSVDDIDYYPADMIESQVEGSGANFGGLRYINTSWTREQSQIHDFIPSIHSRFSEISDIHQQIQDFTGARVYVDTDDQLQLQPIMTPFSAKSGFIITTLMDQNNDLADNTCYIREDYSWSNSISKDAGYSNSTYGVLLPDVPPEKESSPADDDDFFENKTIEIAQRFRPPTNPNWRLFCAVEGVGMTNVQSENTVRGRWRICEDNNKGLPQDNNGIIANKYMYPNEFYSTSDGGQQFIQVMGVGNVDLDVNRWYWLILSSVNATSTEYWRWYHNGSVSRGLVATAPPATSTADDGGSGWTVQRGPVMIFAATRFKGEPFVVRDQKAINKRILIESNAQSFPQQITSKLAANKYLVGLIQYSSRPRRLFNFPSVTVPNNPIFAGDIAYIVDDRFNFSTSGNPVVCGNITDVQYSFGIKGGGISPSSRGMNNMALNVVSFSQFY